MLHDSWAARDAYIEVVLNRSLPNINRFLEQHARSPVDPHQRITVLKLLEMQRHLMLMYTSCAWFFDEVSGIETVQVMQYAARALQLAEELFPGVPLEDAMAAPRGYMNLPGTPVPQRGRLRPSDAPGFGLDVSPGCFRLFAAGDIDQDALNLG